MIRSLSPLRSLSTLSPALAAAVFFALTLNAAAQQTALQPRFAAPLDNAQRVTLAGSRSPLADPAADSGAVPSSLKLNGIGLVFNRTPAQQAELDALITAQQTPNSPLYHQWLTPDQFAARFGMAASDIATVENWLQLQGFAIDSVSRSHDRIFFSGTAALVAAAFGAPLHYFKSTASDGSAITHFAPANDLTLPAVLASSVLAITDLSDFRPHPHVRRTPAAAQAALAVKPNYTMAQTGDHFLTPGDLSTIYDVVPAYSAGFTGINQSIAIVGQSAIVLSDIATFQSAVGIPAKTPQLVVVPGSGVPTVYTGDEGESDLDLEYSSTIAKGAQVFFVYTGNNSNFGVFNALQYAVDERIAPIVSSSYGDCEIDLGLSNYTTLSAILQQAAAQGQTVISAAGDSGSQDCYGTPTLSVAQQETPAADFPASSQYVTGIGGTEFPAAEVAAGNNTYFSPAGTADTVSSALSYIPEVVWNDDLAALAGHQTPFFSGGGGVSIFTPRPTWQTGSVGATAIPAGNFRLVPDISLDASPLEAPLAYCTSDTSYWNTGQLSSCTSGLRDASSGDLTLAGGTSFGAPTFAGMLALIEQSINSTGEGVINPTLYTLASTPATYTSAFHDIITGGNQCLGGTSYCSTAGTADYAATTGYDEASGLGSIDLFHLLTAWPTLSASALAATVTTLVPATTNPIIGASDAITIAVAPVTANTAIPTGTVSLVIDGAPATPPTVVPLVNGIASYVFPATSATAGAHIIVATYSGDTTFASSVATLSLNATAGSFTIAATNISVASGSSATSTVTVTPTGAYTGAVALTLTATASSAGADANLSDSCYQFSVNPLTVPGTSPVTATVTIFTNLATCNAQPSVKGSSHVRFFKPGSASSAPPQRPLSKSLTFAATLAGLFALGLLRRRLRGLPALLAIASFFAVASLGLSGCSNNTTSGVIAPTGNEAPGTYILTLTGTDTNTNQTASSTFTLTIN